ncbi:MAG: methionine aminotransferase [Steroidobacteraceae bacterium]
MPRVTSKLPHIGTTIFTVITQRAQELGAINLAQGFPDYDPPELLKELLAHHAARGSHQYAPMPGVLALRERIAALFEQQYATRFDPAHEITITLGATEALFSAILALVHHDDEVILFDPSYDSYAPAVLLAGGRPVHIPLAPPEFRIDWDQVRSRVSARTRLLIINTPHNPLGRVFSASDLESLERLVEHTDMLVLADEVYEHMVFDGGRHTSLCSRPALRDRTLSVFSFGKPFHATGWRVGYAIANAELTRELRRVHQFNTFTISTPLQLAIAEFLTRAPGYYSELAPYYQAKRDRFNRALQGTALRIRPSQGTYFQLVDFSAVSSLSDNELADNLIREAGVAAIPISPFYAQPPHSTWLRFCFAKQDATLDAATSRIREFARP